MSTVLCSGHELEFQRSAISPDIQRLNFSSKSQSAAAAMGFRASSAGWVGQQQFKPDKPRQDAKGKDIKYESRCGRGNPPAFLAVPLADGTEDRDYWERIKSDISIPIILTEGEKKAACGLSHGLVTISLAGVWGWNQPGTRKFKLELLPYLQPGRVVQLAFDADILTKKEVRKALKAISNALIKLKCEVTIVVWNLSEGKGMDDFIYGGGDNRIEEFRQLLEQALTLEEFYDEHPEDKPSNKKEIPLVAAHKKIKEEWGDRLRFNTMLRQVELDGEPFDLEKVRLELALQLNILLKTDDAKLVVVSIAQENSYSPVVDYLNEVKQQYGSDTSILDDFASRYFGNDEPLANIYLQRFLVSAVNRALNPGCKADIFLVLHGKQGTRKSTFLSTLAGQYFCDDFDLTGDKDEKLKMLQCWLIEVQEFDRLNKRERGALKSFVTTQSDKLREPYARTVKDFPRSSVFVGSTNESELLSDPTGSRRFWIVDINKRIDTEQLRAERDHIWAAAYALYEQGLKGYLTDDEDLIRTEANKSYQAEEVWAEAILYYCENKGGLPVTITEVLANGLQIEVGKQGKLDQMRVADVLKGAGWEKRRSNGLTRWFPPQKEVALHDLSRGVALPGTYTQSAVQESVPPPIESLGGFLDKNQEIIESKKPPKSEKTQTEVALIPETLSQKELQTVPPLDNLGSTTPNWRVLPPLPGIGETWIQADSATQVTIISHERNNDFQVIGRDDDGEVCVINRNDILKGYWKRVALPANCEVSND